MWLILAQANVFSQPLGILWKRSFLLPLWTAFMFLFKSAVKVKRLGKKTVSLCTPLFMRWPFGKLYCGRMQCFSALYTSQQTSFKERLDFINAWCHQSEVDPYIEVTLSDLWKTCNFDGVFIIPGDCNQANLKKVMSWLPPLDILSATWRGYTLRITAKCHLKMVTQ